MPKNTPPVNHELRLSVMVQLACADREEGSPQLMHALWQFSRSGKSLESAKVMVDHYRFAADMLIEGASK